MYKNDYYVNTFYKNQEPFKIGLIKYFLFLTIIKSGPYFS